MNEISNYARQFPNDKISFINCFKHLFNYDDKQDKRYYWPKLIHFLTSATYMQLEQGYRFDTFHSWLIQNTDLKYASYSFKTTIRPLFSVWF